MNPTFKLDIHKALFGSVSSYKSEIYSMNCVDLAVADFSTMIGIDFISQTNRKPYDLFSKEEEVMCLHEFRQGHTLQQVPKVAPEQEQTVSLIVANDAEKQELGDSHKEPEKNTSAEEDIEKRITDLVEAGVSIIFPQGDSTPRLKYTTDQVRYLIRHYFISHKRVAEISGKCDINASTASGYLRKVRHIFEGQPQNNADKQQSLVVIQGMDSCSTLNRPVKVAVPRGNQKLFDPHSRYLVHFFETNEHATLEMARKALLSKFTDLSISKSGIHNHMTTKGCLVVKCLNPGRPVSKSVLAQDEALSGDYVFVDAVDLLMYVRKSFGWRGGEPLSAIHSGIFVPTMAAFSDVGVINISILTPMSVLQHNETYEKSDLDRKIEVYKQFLIKTMGILEKNKFINRTFLTSDIDVFDAKTIQETIQSRNFTLVFRQFFSFQRFWNNFKADICRHELKLANQLVRRMCTASQQISSEDCKLCIEKTTTYE